VDPAGGRGGRLPGSSGGSEGRAAGAPACSDAAGAASLLGGETSAVAAILISSVGADASAATGAVSLGAGVSMTVISGFAIAGGDESSGFSAAIRSGSAGVATISIGSAVSAAAGVFSEALLSGALGSATGGSTRSVARTGLAASLGCANTVSGGARRDGTLTNSSCAARSNAAAPSPNTRTDIDNTMAANKKRRPGSMDASSASALVLRRSLSHWERGDHRTGRHRDRADTAGARESG